MTRGVIKNKMLQWVGAEEEAEVREETTVLAKGAVENMEETGRMVGRTGN